MGRVTSTTFTASMCNLGYTQTMLSYYVIKFGGALVVLACQVIGAFEPPRVRFDTHTHCQCLSVILRN